MFDRDEDDDDSARAISMAAFEAFDDGKLTAENAIEFELPARKPAEESKADGGASGASQAEQGRQQTGKPDSSAATGGEQTGERQRDESGRFAPKGDEKPAGEKPAGEPKPTDQQKPQPSQETPPAPAAAAPEPAPAGLSRQANAVWASATPEVREYIAETESTLAKLYEPMREVFSAAKEIGVPWNQFVGNLVKAERHLRDNPKDALLWLAERSRIDPEELADYAIEKRAGAGNPPPQYANNPDLARAVQPLAEQVAQLTSRLTQRDQAEAQQRQDQAVARNNAIRAEIQKFVSAPERAHWKEVEAEFWAHIPVIKAAKPNAGMTEILQDAYDRATWANPTVRAKLQAEQNQRQADAQRAKRSRGLESLTGHRGSPSPASPAANGSAVSLRDEIAANWAAIDAR